MHKKGFKQVCLGWLRTLRSKKSEMNTKRGGFTLAEVLITLTIIGVVAALTIPTLISNTNTSKYQTAFKKNISVLNQALLTSKIDGTASLASGIGTASELAKVFTVSLNVIANHNVGTHSEVIWLSDGTKIAFVDITSVPSCPDSLVLSGDEVVLASNCYAIIDVNGDKGPNDVATEANFSDVYVVGITQNSVIPIEPSTALPVVAAFTQEKADGNNIVSGSSDEYADTDPEAAAILALTQ